MELGILKAKTSLRKSHKARTTASATFDYASIIEAMKNKPAWVAGDLNASVLLKCPEKQIVLIAMHKGTIIESFQSNDSVTFQVIEGKLTFNTRTNSIILEEGQLLTLHENIKYSLITKEETMLLLTIATGILQSA